MTWVSPAEAQKHYGIKESALRERAQKGRVKRAGGRYWIDDDGVAKVKPFTLDDLPPARPADVLKKLEELHTSQPRVQASSTLEKWVLIPDCHVPFHHKAHFSLMLRAAKSIGADNVAILGDFADFWAVSFHSKSPARRQNFKWEVDEVNAALDEIDAAFSGEKKFVEGNHCYRYARYIQERAAALFDLHTIPELFRLKERGWLFTPYKQHTTIGKLHLTHDAGKAGKTAHVDAMNAFQGNVVIGHTHRLAWTVEGNVQGKPHVGCMLGWLGDVEQVDYMHKVRAARDWAHGFGVAYVEPDGCVHVVPVPIVNGRVCVEGKIVR